MRHFKAVEENYIAYAIEEQKEDSECTDDQFGDSESVVIDKDNLEEDDNDIFGCVGRMKRVCTHLYQN